MYLNYARFIAVVLHSTNPTGKALQIYNRDTDHHEYIIVAQKTFILDCCNFGTK